jgi:hypothetical protein
VPCPTSLPPSQPRSRTSPPKSRHRHGGRQTCLRLARNRCSGGGVPTCAGSSPASPTARTPAHGGRCRTPGAPHLWWHQPSAPAISQRTGPRRRVKANPVYLGSIASGGQELLVEGVEGVDCFVDVLRLVVHLVVTGAPDDVEVPRQASGPWRKRSGSCPQSPTNGSCGSTSRSSQSCNGCWQSYSTETGCTAAPNS